MTYPYCFAEWKQRYFRIKKYNENGSYAETTTVTANTSTLTTDTATTTITEQDFDRNPMSEKREVDKAEDEAEDENRGILRIDTGLGVRSLSDYWQNKVLISRICRLDRHITKD